MDTSVPAIQFDANGVCTSCTEFERRRASLPINQPDCEIQLGRLIDRIRAAGRGKPYDCIIGVSGGVDSTYTAYVAKQLGLRPLAVHFDNGWNSELAVANIQHLLDRLGIHLDTCVADWEEFRDLQVAFLRASTPDGEIPTDHGILATLLRAAVREGLRYIISGSNTTTEGNLPIAWAYGAGDWRYIRSVHSRFGTVPLRTYPHYGLLSRIYSASIRRIRSVQLLNYLPYVKDRVLSTMRESLGWKDYGGKHHESIYTRFFQSFFLPRKFNIDKRRCHLSALIVSGQMTRSDALRHIAEDPYPGEAMERDREYVLKKLRLSDSEFHEILSAPPKTHLDYPTHRPAIERLRTIAAVCVACRLLPARLGF